MGRNVVAFMFVDFLSEKREQKLLKLRLASWEGRDRVLLYIYIIQLSHWREMIECNYTYRCYPVRIPTWVVHGWDAKIYRADRNYQFIWVDQASKMSSI